jgi:hypothetical protein
MMFEFPSCVNFRSGRGLIHLILFAACRELIEGFRFYVWCLVQQLDQFVRSPPRGTVLDVRVRISDRHSLQEHGGDEIVYRNAILVSEVLQASSNRLGDSDVYRAHGVNTRWLRLCVDAGGDGRGLSERMKAAVHTPGASRGLAPATRRNYAGWAGRFGAWAGTVGRVMGILSGVGKRGRLSWKWGADSGSEGFRVSFAEIAGQIGAALVTSEFQMTVKPCFESFRKRDDSVFFALAVVEVRLSRYD